MGALQVVIVLLRQLLKSRAQGKASPNSLRESFRQLVYRKCAIGSQPRFRSPIHDEIGWDWLREAPHRGWRTRRGVITPCCFDPQA
jgi:hypothetical protein